VYGDPLSNPKLDPYPDGFLEWLAAVGSTERLHVILRDSGRADAFPEFGAGMTALANLRALVKRASTTLACILHE
jgi:hypothetical protein